MREAIGAALSTDGQRRHVRQETRDNLHSLRIIQSWYGGPLPGTW